MRHPCNRALAISGVWGVVVVLGLGPSEAATFPGTVIGSDGQPVPDAKVWLVRVLYGPPQDVSVVATGQTDRVGAFTLADPAPEKVAAPNHWRVFAYKDGLALDALYVATPDSPLRLVLRGPSVSSAKVLGDPGLPLVGATVELTGVRWGAYGQPDFRHMALASPIASELATRTDDTGTFALRLTPAGSSVAIAVTAEGYGRVQFRNAELLTVARLARAGRLTVQLVCPEEPQAGAGVEVYLDGKLAAPDGGTSTVAPGPPRPPGASPRSAPEAYAYITLTTDTQGRLTVLECPPGAYEVGLLQQPAGTHHFRTRTGVTVSSGQETTLELTAERTAPAQGRVVRADNGEPIAGAEVSLDQSTREAYYRAPGGVSDPAGRYELLCLPGRYAARATRDGYVPALQGGSQEVEVEPDGAAVPDIRLETAYTVRVLVLDEEDEPVPGAFVMAEGADWESRFTRETDAEGRVEATGLRRDELDLWAYKDDLSVAAPVRFRLGEEQGPVTLVLKRGAACGVAATVVDQLGAPVTDAHVVLWEHTRSTIHRGAEGRPDERGQFRRSGLKVGLEYEAQVEAPNCDPVTTPGWTATTGETHDCGVIILTRYTGAVGGLVVDQAGAPVPGVLVFDAEDAPKGVETRTDEQGRFRLEGLNEGPALVFVDSPDHAFTAVPTEAGALDLTITLHPKQSPAMGDLVPPCQPVIPLDEGRERAKALLVEALAQAPNGTPMRWRLVSALADVDPDFALQYVNDNADDPKAVCLPVARAHMEDGFGEVVDLIWQRGDRYAELRMLREAALEYRTPKLELFRECVEEALAIIESTPAGPDRACDTASWSELVRDFDPLRADAMLSQAATEARQLDPAGRQAYARGRVAACLCEHDLQAALDLVMPVGDEHTRDGGLRRIISRVGKTDPQKATGLLGRLSNDFERDQAIAEAIPFFPENQLDLASSLTDRMGYPPSRMAALGRLCAVAPRERVPELIEKALAAYPDQSPGSSPYMAYDSQRAGGLASLACIARRRGYSQYREIALRAMAGGVRDQDPPVPDAQGRLHLGREFQVGWVLAFTAPDLARHAIEASFRRAGGVERLLPVSYYSLAAAAAEVDVDWALALLKQMTPDAPDADALYRTYAIEAVACRLSADAEAREYRLLAKNDRLVTTGPTYNWIPVHEDQ